MARKNNNLNNSMFDFSEIAVTTGRSLAVIKGKDGTFDVEKAAADAQYANLRASMIAADAKDTAEEIFEEFKARIDEDIDELDEQIKNARQSLSEKEQELRDALQDTAQAAGDAWWEKQHKAYSDAAALFGMTAPVFTRHARFVYEKTGSDKARDINQNVEEIRYSSWSARDANKRKILGIMSIEAEDSNRNTESLTFAPVSIKVSAELPGLVAAVCKDVAALRTQINAWQDESQQLQREADPGKIAREVALFVKKARNAARAEAGDVDHEKRVMAAANALYQRRKGLAKASLTDVLKAD